MKPHTQRHPAIASSNQRLSGYTIDKVRVHYNSDKPSQLQPHAYAPGSDIDLVAEREQYLSQRLTETLWI